MVGHEWVRFDGAGDLVGLLEILAGVECICRLGGQSVESDSLKMVGPRQISCDAQHFLQGIHHFRSGTELGPSDWIAEVYRLVTRPQAGWEADCRTDCLHRVFWGIEILRLVRLLPPNDRRLESLCEIDAVDGILSAEHITGCEHGSEVDRLVMDQFRQVKKELLPSQIVEPIDYPQVVGITPFTPE